MSGWVRVLSAEEITAHHALTATLDPAFARAQREFYESRTVSELSVLAHQAWNCNSPDSYQLAISYRALIEGNSVSTVKA